MRIDEFLLARIAEDEAVARAATPGPWQWWNLDVETPDVEHILRFDPARVLAECKAKRRIVALHTGDHECSGYDHNDEVELCVWISGEPCETTKAIAHPYADHPDFDPAWAR